VTATRAAAAVLETDLPEPTAWAIRCTIAGRSAFAPGDCWLKDDHGRVRRFADADAAATIAASESIGFGGLIACDVDVYERA